MSKRMPPSRYRDHLDQIDLRQLAVVQVYSKLLPENLSEGPISVEMKNEIDISYSRTGNRLNATDKYEFIGTIKQKPVLDIKVQILAGFELLGKPNADFIELFQQHTLKLITYPYLRQIVQDLTSKMGVPPLVLPMWRAPKRSGRKSLATANDVSRN